MTHRKVAITVGDRKAAHFSGQRRCFFRRNWFPETKGRPLEHIDEYWTNGHHWPEIHANR